MSWTIINSLFSHNRAIGDGGNPAESGSPGGGSGGAIYNDGNTMTLSLCGCRLEYNEVNAFGSAIFFVTNDHSGDMRIDRSAITVARHRPHPGRPAADAVAVFGAARLRLRSAPLYAVVSSSVKPACW